MNIANTNAYEKFGLSIIILMVASLVLVAASSRRLNGLRPVLEARNLDSHLLRNDTIKEVSADQVAKDEDDLLLLPSGFDRESCLSRHKSPIYRKRRPRLPASPHLVAKLRSYEARHKRCGPHTGPFNQSVDDLKSSRVYNDSSARECNYIVWVPYDGLGNRILTITAAFLYALLTDRILLLDRGADVDALFCEPFPEASWLLPTDFPFANKFRNLNWWSHQSYGEMLRDRNDTTASMLLPQPYIFLNLLVFSKDSDKRFYCDRDQAYLQKIPWLVIKSNVYFVPSLFLMPMFQEELDGLFPNKEAVFHLLGQYLLHPTNSVWGLVTRYYDAYLSGADTTVGIQVRVLGSESSPSLSNHFSDQIKSCIARENILPEIGSQEEKQQKQEQKKKRVGVVMTSLSAFYSQQVRDLYWENPTAMGEVVAVSQPSNEGRQKTEKTNHNKKAWAEIYLLSLTDKLVTSSWSTFGYVAQGLGGLRPWILALPGNDTTPDPPCRRGESMEPCFHGPPKYTCRTTTTTTTRVNAVVPHVRPCEDRPWDIKLFPHT